MPWMDKLKTSASVAKTRANRKYRNSEYEELDVTIVKATSEEESPPKEKHVRSILSIVYMDS
eukprot:jgi/Pico_ML_1/56054/g1650.t1